MTKRSIFIIAALILLLAAAVAGMWKMEQRQQIARVAKPAHVPTLEETRVRKSEPKPAKPVPAFQIAPTAASLGPTLDPEMFTGSARTAYQIAREIPETLAEVPCYCHCDRGFGHKSLHSCFKDEHGANCSMCINEAIAAYKMTKETKMSPREIREAIIRQFGK